MRRRRGEQTVNLFAFQDIITGVAGVMLFILMVLVVQLSMKLAAQAAEVQQEPVAPPLPEINDPYADLETLQAELKQLRRDNQELLTATSQDIRTEIQEAQSELAEIVRQAEIAKAEAESLQQKVESQELSDERKSILARRQKLREQLASLEQEQVRHQHGKLVAFKTSANRSRKMWVIDLHDSYADLFDVQSPMSVTKVDFDRKNSPGLIVAQIKSALSEQTKARSIVLVLRPSVAGAGAVYLSDFRGAGFTIALELLDEDSLITESGDVKVNDPNADENR